SSPSLLAGARRGFGGHRATEALHLIRGLCLEREAGMADDDIRYALLTQEALRGVIRKVLSLVQRGGLPGQHHLYIAFDTEAEGVIVSKRLKEQYPEEMTIVLQYQFWDLQVANDRFEVKLSFSNVPERLVVPFNAVKAFYDPSAQFGLQFGKPGAANDSARQHMAAALPDL